MVQTTGFLTKSLVAATAIIRAYRLVVYGAADGTGVEATGTTAFIFGVSSELDTAIGERCSVHGNGNMPEVLYGGTVTRGDALTSDAQGRAITATVAGQRCVGFAAISGVAGDIGQCTVSPFVF